MTTSQKRQHRLENNALGAAQEAMRAARRYPAFHSAHEGYAVLLEEVDELWREIKVSHELRLTRAGRREAMQVAAMALRMLAEL